jgi:GDP-L-fucose synthase
LRVMVTGGSGFFGSAVTSELRSRGNEYDVYPVSRSTGYDLLTERGRLEAFRDSRPDAVIHLAAAVGGIGANVAEPGRFFYENVTMGAELMELARLAGVAKFVTIGTSCEYPDNAPIPLQEGTLWDGYPARATSAYALAKRALLEMGTAYREQYGFNSIHLLPTNLYGPGDSFDLKTGHVIPSLIHRLSDASNGSTVTCWGTGRATRDFLHVQDAARAVRLALEKYDQPEPLNLGSGVETSIKDVAWMIAHVVGFKGEIAWDKRKPEGTPRRAFDMTKAREWLRFEPAINLKQGIRETIYWYGSQR